MGDLLLNQSPQHACENPEEFKKEIGRIVNVARKENSSLRHVSVDGAVNLSVMICPFPDEHLQSVVAVVFDREQTSSQSGAVVLLRCDGCDGARRTWSFLRSES